jgi:D-alanyl-lipoteichoic acid acyltransferase DltB (MBOAT superfamily)
MIFNSLTFMAFFSVVLLLHNLPLSWRVKKLNLLLASYVFYAAWNPPFVVLLWISTLVDWFAAAAMGRTSSFHRRRALLILSLAVNLGMLGFFKYGNFLVMTFSRLIALVGIEYSPPDTGIFLPIGISFYTFQTLSYTFDVYRGKIRPWPSFLDFAMFVTFFPQLVAGPIVRAAEFLPQCLTPKRASATQLGWGASLLVLGIFEKAVLADGVMAPIADTVYGAIDKAGFFSAWMGTIAFGAQIFFDFAGYSTCAIGAGLCLGFVLPDNFRFPYAAVGFSDFWRRWHISLSSWLRDYLYVSLGGNRHGLVRTQVNLMLTMLLGGLWHGAAWHFVVWGGLHGTYLVAERVARSLWGGARWTRTMPARLGLALLTYLLVHIAWVFFRAPSFRQAWTLLKAMCTGRTGTLELDSATVALSLGVTAIMLYTQWRLRHSSVEDLWQRVPWWGRSLGLAGLIICILLVPGDDRAFIYFQF